MGSLPLVFFVCGFVYAASDPAGTISTTGTRTALDCRDRFLWPFNATSIWNTPIGSGAQYVPAGIYSGDDEAHGLPFNVHNDQDWLVLTTADDPVVQWIDDSGNFPGMCGGK